MKRLSFLNNFKDIYYYASFFRVVVCLLLLIDFFFIKDIFKYLFEVNNFSSLLKSSNLFNVFNNNYEMVFVGYIISIIIYMLGVAHYYGAFLFYFFFFIVTIMLNNVSTWGDLILLFTMLFFIFSNSFKYFTLFKNKLFLNPFLDWLTILSFISIIIHLYYVLSINFIHKITGIHWQDGSAIGIGILLEKHIISFPYFLELAQSRFFSSIISYLVLLEQIFFIPLTLINKTRAYMLVFSFLIHFSIAIVFMLVKFQLIMFLLFGFIMYIPHLKNQIINSLK